MIEKYYTCPSEHRVHRAKEDDPLTCRYCGQKRRLRDRHDPQAAPLYTKFGEGQGLRKPSYADLRARVQELEREVARVTRFEVIDQTGRVYSNRPCKVQLSYQDDGETLKVFVEPIPVPGE